MLKEDVAEAIGRRIASGEWPSHETIPVEGEIARRHGVSRTVVREAMQALAAKGLVESRRKRGAVVTDRSQWNLFDRDVLSWWPQDRLASDVLAPLAELRLAVEPVAAEVAARRADPHSAGPLLGALDGMRNARTVDAFSFHDVEFHCSILVMTGNPLFGQIARLMRPLLSSVFDHGADPIVSAEVPTMAQHERLCALIAGRKPRAAANAMRELLMQGRHQGATDV